MNDNLTEVVAILDRSGSMERMTGDTIGGFNSFISEQKEGPGEAVLTTVLFNDKYRLLHDRVNIRDVKNMTRRDYKATGNTALLDAMGKTINDIGLKLRDTPEHERPGKVIVFIITDGEENSSSEFTNEKIKEMVELQKNSYNWEFIFIGANIDSFSTATSLGISGDLAFEYDDSAAGISSAHHAMSKAVSMVRRSRKLVDRSFAEAIVTPKEEK